MSREKVFGIGLSRTGTLSLSLALDQLGWYCVHFPNDDVTFRQLRCGDLDLACLEQYDAVCDTPIVPYFVQLAERLPDSKFILTIRDLADWHSSAEHFWKVDWEDQLDPYHRFVNTAVYGIEVYERTRFDFVYRRHVQEVLYYFRDKPGRLLVMDICAGEGWDKLCPFLGIDIPDVSFPHGNKLR